MFKDFKKYNFAVIDVTMSAVPEMTINLNGITFNGKVLDVLGNPEYVKALIDAENKAFAIQAAKQTDDRAMKFSKTENNGGFSSTCSVIRATLRRLMGDSWKDSMRYRMKGVHFPEAKAVVFDLSAAEELMPLRAAKTGKEE